MKLHLPENKCLVFETLMPMRWSDMDAYGHANNTVYLRYFEEARILWIAALGHGLTEDQQGPVVANIFCNFRRQLEYPADLRIRLYISEPGRSSCDVWMELERDDQPGVLYADGGTTMVWIDFATQKPIALPQWLREAGSDAVAGQAAPPVNTLSP